VTVTARVLWIAVVLSLTAAAVVVTAAARARTAAADELQDVTTRWDALQERAREQAARGPQGPRRACA
jgi:hypothetical protein